MKTRGYLLLGLLICILALIDKSLIASWIGYQWISIPLLLIILLAYYQQKYWPLAVAVLSGLCYDLLSFYPPTTYLVSFSLIAIVVMVLVRTIFSHRSFFSLCVVSFVGSILFFFIPFLYQVLAASVSRSLIPHITERGLIALLIMIIVNILIGAFSISFFYRRPNFKIRPYLYS